MYSFAQKQIHSTVLPPSVPQTASDVKAEAVERLSKLVRSRRNVPVSAVPQFKRLPDFWGWYKYFMDTHNQEGVSPDAFQYQH